MSNDNFLFFCDFVVAQIRRYADRCSHLLVIDACLLTKIVLMLSRMLTKIDTRFWMSRANASKSGMGMWPGAYCVRSSWSEASLADIVSAAVAEGGGGVDV